MLRCLDMLATRQTERGRVPLPTHLNAEHAVNESS
ncbi:MAG: hypothetical protein JWN85_3572 [Gammaproteobacteria bacterium]|nr:hypothetical protein [Gammaproteobacteria bacterium]